MNLENKIVDLSTKNDHTRKGIYRFNFSKGDKKKQSGKKRTSSPLRPLVETQPALRLLPSIALSSGRERADKLLAFS
jgi:hypothetical protein